MSIHALSRQYNLKLDTWYPADIKQVHKPDFNIDCHNLSIQEVINKAILSTYDVLQDDKLLRRSPREFEELRENYPLRREFHAYSPHLLNDTENISLVLNALGFCIPSDNYQI